ncbi:MAG: response regulator [Prolixibacteraceae bacterium]
MTEKSSPFSFKPTPGLVLVAEDDDISYSLIEIILSQRGNKILRAITGKEAIEIFKQNPDISLILMDLKMPVMDGYEATAEIKKMNSEVPVLAQTAYALAGDDKKALRVGCDDYITKPIKKDDLLKKIDSLLKQYSNH